MLVQERRLACASFMPWWNDVVRDALVFVQERKIAHASFPPQWNDLVRDVYIVV